VLQHTAIRRLEHEVVGSRLLLRQVAREVVTQEGRQRDRASLVGLRLAEDQPDAHSL